MRTCQVLAGVAITCLAVGLVGCVSTGDAEVACTDFVAAKVGETFTSPSINEVYTPEERIEVSGLYDGGTYWCSLEQLALTVTDSIVWPEKGESEWLIKGDNFEYGH